MPKNVLQDMVRIKPRDKKEMDREVERLYAKNKFDLSKNIKNEDKNENKNDGGGRSKSNHGLWAVAFIAIVFLFFALTFLFAKAKIVVNPKVEDLALGENLLATKNGGAEELSFDLVAIPGEETRTVAGGEKKEVNQKATGSVIIYNTYSNAVQNLDIDTRLEGSNGKIYKTQTKVVVPGTKGDGTPGSVEVKITASEAGAEYNSPPMDFKIFGFKGTPKYAKFYARSKGAITGGQKGLMSTISDADKAKLVAEAKTALEEKLFKKANDQIPSGFILFKDAVFLDIDEETVAPAGVDGQVPVVIKGTLYGFLLEEEGLTDKIVKALVSNYDGSKVHVKNIRDLVFSLANRDSIASYKDVQTINFKLSGNTKVVWDVDTEKLAADVLGKKKKDFRQILLGYPNIDTADLVIRPVWKMSFPQKRNDIEVTVNTP